VDTAPAAGSVKDQLRKGRITDEEVDEIREILLSALDRDDARIALESRQASELPPASAPAVEPAAPVK